MKNNYFEILEFSKSNKEIWNDFCLKSDSAWLWHTYESIISKTFWFNHLNLSFGVIDKSNRNKIIAIFPVFLVKKKKIIDYSTLESLGGSAFENNIKKVKYKKLLKFIKEYLSSLQSRYKVYKCEILLSTLSKSIIESKKVIPNPLGELINIDKSTFTWIKNLKKQNINELFKTFDNKTKQSINKNINSFTFNEVDYSDTRSFLNKYFSFHLTTTRRKKINHHSKKYFEYIFYKFPIKNKKIFYVKENENILSFAIFGIYKNNVIYWSSASSKDGIVKSSNYYCMWKAIEYFSKKKVNYIEFGEGFFNDDDPRNLDLNHFKKSFSGEMYPLFRGERVENKFKNFTINVLRELYTFKKK